MFWALVCFLENKLALNERSNGTDRSVLNGVAIAEHFISVYVFLPRLICYSSVVPYRSNEVKP